MEKPPKPEKPPPKPKKKKGGLVEWGVPEGYTVQSEKPTAEQLAFENDAGDALVGRHLMYNWDGVGWCEGVIEQRNTDKRFKLGTDFVNFWVYCKPPAYPSLLAPACLPHEPAYPTSLLLGLGRARRRTPPACHHCCLPHIAACHHC